MLTLRPQPLGVFAGPQGALLLPFVDDADALAQVLHGELQAELPEPWQFYALAIGDDAAALARIRDSDAPEHHLNRFILQPSLEHYHTLQTELIGEGQELLEAIAYQLDYRQTPPEPQHATQEIRAYLLATQAHHLLAQQAIPEGLALLEQAAELVESISPAFAARLFGEWAGVESMTGALSHKGMRYFEKALELFQQTAFHDAEAELWLQYGMACQSCAAGQRGWLLKAVNAYQMSLRTVSRTHLPESYGLAQMNMALCYLNMPMNQEADKLRPAIAVQALREALQVFDKAQQPELWASATLNLANALQHAKTSHPEDNLWEAVALYQDVLEVRDADCEPLGYARVLANQGNALAHLGAFSRAVPRLEEARAIFSQQQDDDAAASISEILEDIAERKPASASELSKEVN